MSLYSDLQTVKSEEDVKDAYIKALNLKSFTKGLIDIQTKEVWFEAKDTTKHTTYSMFTQLLHYVQDALNKGEHIPPLLAVIDVEKAAVMKSSDVIPFLSQKTVKWGKSASKYTQEALETISAHIGTYFVHFNIATDEEEFLSTVKEAIKSGDIIRTQITPDNLKQVFDKWVEFIGREIQNISEDDFHLLFFADVMHDGKIATYQGLPSALVHINDAPAFKLHDKIHELKSIHGYRKFWSIYHKPPKSEFRDYLLERRDSLIPVAERIYKGSFYTPLNVVDKAYDQLTRSLGKSWQSRYFVWDMCCGVGNLEVKHSNHRNIFMSTLDQVDVDVMKATKTCAASYRFQYDYLNDDITEDGKIDYSISNKLPKELRRVIKEEKKILVLINPPYAEGMGAGSGVAATRVGSKIGVEGYAKRELFTQFLARITLEMPNAVIAMFSKMKYINAPNFEGFRRKWHPTFKGGFVVHSKAFDGLRGNFPIGFLIWDTATKVAKNNKVSEITVEVLDKQANPIGAKTFYPCRKSALLNTWITRPKSNSVAALPLSNALSPTTRTTDLRGAWWAEGAIGGMICKGSDLQNASSTTIFSSSYNSAGGFLITKDNLPKVAMVFTARRIIKQTWLNDRDQFLIPTDNIDSEFSTDCLLWMLFHSSNNTAGADGLVWSGRTWSLVNHFIPFIESEVDAPERFESDFMSQYVKTLNLSKESKAVKNEGQKIWAKYFEQVDEYSVREELKLNRPDVGWYQIRRSLDARKKAGMGTPVNWQPFKNAYEELTLKLRPQIYRYGFLKN